MKIFSKIKFLLKNSFKNNKKNQKTTFKIYKFYMKINKKIMI